MNILEELTAKLDKMSKEFQELVEENTKLKNELQEIKNENDLFERTTQDTALMITNMLQKDGKL